MGRATSRTSPGLWWSDANLMRHRLQLYGSRSYWIRSWNNAGDSDRIKVQILDNKEVRAEKIRKTKAGAASGLTAGWGLKPPFPRTSSR